MASSSRRLAATDGLVARLAADLAARIAALTADIDGLARQIAVLIQQLAPSLLALIGVGHLTAAKIAGQTAGVARFRFTDAYARHNSTAPLPAWSGALTQIRCHPQGQAYLKTRIAAGDTKTEALRAVKRRLSDTVYRALLADGTTMPVSQAADIGERLAKRGPGRRRLPPRAPADDIQS